MDRTKTILTVTSVALTAVLLLIADQAQLPHRVYYSLALAFGGTIYFSAVVVDQLEQLFATESGSESDSDSDSEPQEISDESESESGPTEDRDELLDEQDKQRPSPRRSPRRFFRKQCQHCGNSKR